jgi:hypothetical protein
LVRESERKSMMGLRKIIETSLKIAWTILSILTNTSRFSSFFLVHVKIASFREGHDCSFNSFLVSSLTIILYNQFTSKSSFEQTKKIIRDSDRRLKEENCIIA